MREVTDTCVLSIEQYINIDHGTGSKQCSDGIYRVHELYLMKGKEPQYNL